MPRSKKHIEVDDVLNIYVTTERLSKSTGLTEGALRKYIERKKVELDVHYFHAANGRIMWVVAEFNQWLIGGKVLRSTVGASGTHSSKPNSKVNFLTGSTRKSQQLRV